MRLNLRVLGRARAMAALFQCNATEPATKKRTVDGGSVDGTGSQPSQGSTGQTAGGQYGMTIADVENLAVRTAQVLSIHDVRLREFGTMTRRVKLPVNSEYGKLLSEVDGRWKTTRREGGTLEGSKHLKLASVMLEKLYHGLAEGDEVKVLLGARWNGKDTSTPAFLGTDVRVVKWRTLKNKREGVIEFMLVPELAVVERTLLRVLVAEPGAEELTGMEAKGPQIREVETLIEGTWRRA